MRKRSRLPYKIHLGTADLTSTYPPGIIWAFQRTPIKSLNCCKSGDWSATASVRYDDVAKALIGLYAVSCGNGRGARGLRGR